MRMKILSFLVIAIMAIAIEGSAQSPMEDSFWPTFPDGSIWFQRRERRQEIERLKSLPEPQRLEALKMYRQFLDSLKESRLKSKYLLNSSGSSEYCAADHGSTPSSRPFRWCRYDSMGSCLEATRDHSSYSCEPNRFYGDP